MIHFDSHIDENNTKKYFINGGVADIYKDAYAEFSQLYEIQNVKLDSKSCYDIPIARSKRRCIFCDLTYPDTSFKSKAHLIPKFLGNKNLLSFIECDECNNFFSAYESDLSNYLGIKKIRYSNDNKKLQPPGKGYVLSRIPKSNLINLIHKDKIVKVIVNNDKIVIPFRTHSYSILNIWKLLIKVALTCMPENDVKLYSGLITTLFKDCLYTHETHYPQIYTVYRHTVKASINTPIAVLYKKRDKNSQVFTHTFQLYFMDEVWQVFLPMNDLDDGLYSTTSVIKFPYCPPSLVDNELLSKIKTEPKVQVFHANRKARDFHVQSIKGPITYLKNNLLKYKIIPDNIRLKNGFIGG